MADDARWNLRGRHLAVHRAGETQKTRFDMATPDVVAARIGQLLDA